MFRSQFTNIHSSVIQIYSLSESNSGGLEWIHIHVRINGRGVKLLPDLTVMDLPVVIHLTVVYVPVARLSGVAST